MAYLVQELKLELVSENITNKGLTWSCLQQVVLDAVDIEAGVAREGLEKVDDSV